MNIEIDNFIADLLAKNKALFGDIRMEAEEEKQEGSQEGQEGTTEGSEGETGQEGKGESNEGSDALPEWAKKELANVRAEAANYRTKLRDAESKLSAAKTPEEVEAAISELREQNAKLERTILVSRVASKHNLPSELADVLKGDDEAALEAHAKTLAKFAASVQSEPTKLEGGLDPADEVDSETDPRKLARRFRRI